MATLHEASKMDWSGKPFWGLVQQDGPWKSTPSDRKRAGMKDTGTFGGGNGVGGRGHAGHGNFAQVMTPYQISAISTPPPPSGYAMRNVMMDSVDMKRQTKMGMVKSGLTLHARTPMQTGHKMGHAPEEVRQEEAGDIMPPVRIEATPSFSTTHHIMDMKSEGGPENIMHFGIPIESTHVPSISKHEPFHNQEIASMEAIYDERKRKMSGLIDELAKRHKGTEKPGPSTLGKRKGSATLKDLYLLQHLTEQKKSKGTEEAGPSILGKRKASIEFMKKPKSARTIFKGPLKPTEQSAPVKRKLEGYKEISVKKQKKEGKEKPPKINTRIGKRFGEGKAEKKSAPKKHDELPEVRSKRSKK